ncbi:MAG: hypothetical protein ACT4P6_09830 [Gemmatimonadaceae bacterium]
MKHTIGSYPEKPTWNSIPAGRGSQPDVMTDARIDVEVLHRRLPPREWQLLFAKYVVEQSTDGIMETFRLSSEDACRQAVLRARRRARAILET